MNEQYVYNSLGVLRGLIRQVENEHLRSRLNAFVDANIKAVGVYSVVTNAERQHVPDDHLDSYRMHKLNALGHQMGKAVLPLCERIMEEGDVGEMVTLKAFLLFPTTPEVRRDWSEHLGDLKEQT